ncbi:MAG: DMT family transporter [Clostridia bacterium]|nr:DMT family transporter [Clostridia bacterium]
MNKNKLMLYALLVMLLWGTLFPMVKLGYTVYNIVTTGDILFFAGVRFSVCGAIICLYSFITDREAFKAVIPSLTPILLSGFFAIILHYGFTYTALKLTDSSKTAILKQVGVLLYVCFSFMFFKEDKPTVKKLIGVLMGFVGIVAINTSSDGISFNIGDILIIAASFCTVFSNIISKKVFRTVKPIISTGISQLFGGVILLIAGSLLGGGMSLAFNQSALIMVYICFASVFSYSIWYTVVKNGELSKLLIIKFAESVFACVFGAIILNENIFKVQYVFAFLLIATGIYISNK